MKLPILILTFFALTSAIYAQNFRTDTVGDRQIQTYFYDGGGVFVRWERKGEDSVLRTTTYYRNGVLKSDAWAKDSSYRYDVFGRLMDKRYSHERYDFTDKNSVKFYPNGQLSASSSFKDGVLIVKTFDEKGQLTRKHTEMSKGLGFYTRTELGNGIATDAWRRDTLVADGFSSILRTFDTTFYKTGQVYKTEIHRGSTFLSRQFYDTTGKLVKTVLPDSIQLIEFKDNVDCFYGLKNKRGDTIVKPLYDHIKKIDDTFYAAHQGTIVFLFDLNGAPIQLPVARLSDIKKVDKTDIFERWHSREIKQTVDTSALIRDTATVHYVVKTDNKYGIMDAKFALVLPPQYLTLTGNYLGNADFFEFEEKLKDSTLREGYLMRDGQQLFGKQGFKKVNHLFGDYFTFYETMPPYHAAKFDDVRNMRDFKGVYPNYFWTENKGKALPINKIKPHLMGLGTSNADVVLPPKFFNIKQTFPFNASFLTVSVIKENKTAQTGMRVEGIFNKDTKRWLLDTTDFILNAFETDAFPYFSVENVRTQKQGIMDISGKYILPLDYDYIEKIREGENLFLVKKKDKYQLFEINKTPTKKRGAMVAKGRFILPSFCDSIEKIRHEDYLFVVKKDGKYQVIDGERPDFKSNKPKYDFLEPVQLSTERTSTPPHQLYCFLAKQNEKWGVVDAKDSLIKPFEYDYVSLDGDNSKFMLVKDNQAAYYDLASLPNTAEWIKPQEQLKSYSLLGHRDSLFFVNKKGRVVIPPQYKWLRGLSKGDYAVVLDKQQKKKIVFYATSAIVDYPFDYNINFAHANCRILIVNDSMPNTYGVVSTDGRQLFPCNNYGVSIADLKASVFFVKKESPVLRDTNKLKRPDDEVFPNALESEDKDWLMYDSNGKQLNAKPFNFPIDYQNGVGIGSQDDVFNLYKNDGTILQPFYKQEKMVDSLKKGSNTEGSILGYNNARKDGQTGFYVLYHNQGMTPTLQATKPNGEIVVESGRYDGISDFFGRFALVSAQNKIGLIDSFGRERIEPQDLRSSAKKFMDTLYAYVKQADGLSAINNNKKMPFQFQPNNKNTHPDLEKYPQQRAALFNLLFEKNIDNCINTASNKDINHAASIKYPVRNHPEDIYILFFSTRNPIKSKLSEKTIAFILPTNENMGSKAFYNFHLKNNRWEELTINDLLQVQGDKRWLLNDLMTKKIKALKDQSIDCSNASAFITTVENRFMLTKEGIDFCFDSTGGGRDFVVIAFTWAELGAFLKMQIY